LSTMREEYLAAIGEIAVNFNHLEHELESLVWWFIAGDDQELGKVITEKRQFEQLQKLLGRLVTHRYPAQSDPARRAFVDWLSDAKKVYVRRNKIIHSMLLGPFVEGESEIIVTMRRTENAPVFRRPKIEEFRRIAADIEAEAQRATRLMYAHGVAYPLADLN
jgi:hypothetical protein